MRNRNGTDIVRVRVTNVGWLDDRCEQRANSRNYLENIDKTTYKCNDHNSGMNSSL